MDYAACEFHYEGRLGHQQPRAIGPEGVFTRIKGLGFEAYLSPPRVDISPLKPNDRYRVRTAPLTSKRCILYIYSTNIGTEYFKRGIYSPFFSSKCNLFHNSNVFGSCIIHIFIYLFDKYRY